MRLLLDTNTFLWWAYEPQHLPHQILAACEDRKNTLIISVATIWEIQTKIEAERRKSVQTPIHKSPFQVDDDASLQHLLTTQQAQGVIVRTITLRHVRGMAQLPWYHKDPLDRIILATALVDQCRLISSDSSFPAYIPHGVDLWWP